MGQQLNRQNHYVPVWYQRRFFTGSNNSLYRLDLDPPTTKLASGRTVVGHAVAKLSPKSCFWTQDLYTTQFGTTLSDEIERYLFGEIDNAGAKAVRAFAGNDHRAIHESFQDFFAYLDAQKLRTPKGLDWIKSRYADLTQLELMQEMQGLRQMHCTMWTESVREIVSAEQSDVKFIVTDHPITIYNNAYPPESSNGIYPNDPPIDLVGSQTVFVLDANHCIILTNLEYAEHPDSATLTVPRTNARYRGRSMVRTDAFIRSRKLTRDEVIAINYLLKRRARKYVAAGEADWLYPERTYSGDWSAIGKILLPQEELWQFGGEIYVGHNDGSTYFQDAFGRTSGAHKYLHKKQHSRALEANGLCGCGSGRKFKKCCKDVPELDRPSWGVYSIRERNLMFCRAVADILGLNVGKTWNDVQRELSDDHVKRIYEAFASLWPDDTDMASLLPHPDRNTLRAVYLGTIDSRTVEANATGWLAYIDELVLPHPFVNPIHMTAEYSPIQSPRQHKEQTLKNVYLLLLLQPFIDAGFVHLIPDMADFNGEFRKTMWKMAEARTANWKLDKADMEQPRRLLDDDYNRNLKRLPEPALFEYVRRNAAELSSEQIGQIVKQMKEDLANDPLALLQPVMPGEENAQLQAIKGFNLETAMFLAGLTGSVIYTDTRLHWRHLHEHMRTVSTSLSDSVWKPVEDIAKSLIFPIELDPEISYQARMTGKFGKTREMLRRIGTVAQEGNGRAKVDQLAEELKQVEQYMLKQWPTSASPLRFSGNLELSVPTEGFQLNTVRRLQLTFGRAKNIQTIPMAMFVRYTPLPQNGVHA